MVTSFTPDLAMGQIPQNVLLVINNISTDELMPFCTTRSLFIYFIYLKLSVHVQNSRQQ